MRVIKNCYSVHLWTTLLVQILATITLILLSSIWLTIKSGNPIWEFESSDIWILTVFGLAFFTSLSILNLQTTKNLRIHLRKIVVVTLSVFSIFFFCLYILNFMPLRLTLISTIFSALLLSGFSKILQKRKLEICLLSLIIIFSICINLAYQLNFLPPKQKPIVSERFIASQLYDLKVSHYKYPFPKPDTAGGGIASIAEGYLLATGDGTLYFFDEPEDNVSIKTKKLNIRIPINNQDFRRDVGDNVQYHNFRVTDLLVLQNGTNQQIFAAHHFWNQQQHCFVIRVSMLESEGQQFTLLPESTKWNNIFETQPCLELKNYIRGQPFAGEESGGRLVMLGKNRLLLTVGDHEREGWNSEMILAQDESADYGKILEIDIQNGKSKIVSMGHRNPQGLYVDKDGAIWSTEHGPEGGDELNLISRDKNYGWPLVSYGVDYGRKFWPLSEHQGSHDGFEKPVYSWIPAIGVSNLVGAEKTMFKMWKDDLIISSLRDRSIWRVRIHNHRLVLGERIEIGTRIRDMIVGKKGEIILWNEKLPEIVFIKSMKSLIRGEVLFARCIGCHSVGNPASNFIGPDLANIVGRKIASKNNFDYSSVLYGMASDVWTEERLELFLSDPKLFAPGTSMQFDGIKHAESRKILVKYLKDL